MPINNIRPTYSQAVEKLGAEGAPLLDAVLEDAPFGVYVDNPSEGCTYANAELLKMFGVDWDDFRGFGWARHILPQDAERLQAAIREYEHTREPIHVTYRVGTLEDFRSIHARVHAMVDPITDRHVGSAGVVRDVTDEQNIMRRAAHTQKLEAAGRLSARFAHDFNNLLTVMMSTHDLLNSGLDGEFKEQILGDMNLAIQQATQLTGQLLTLSRKQVSSRAVIELDEELKKIERLIHSNVGERVTVQLNLSASECMIPLDVGQLGQVVLNLITNARDAIDGSGILRVATEDQESEVAIIVEDEGQGIRAEHLPHLFEPFFTTKPEGRGTGLGLTSIKNIVETVGGRIEVESEIGRGTKFTVMLPRLAMDIYASVPAVLSAVEGDGKTLLVVEDNEAIRQSLSYALALAKFNVIAAGTIEEAIKRSQEHGSIDALITDIMLPDGMGPELVRALRQDAPDLLVIYTSGFAGEAAAKIRENSTTLFVPKPFRSHEILISLGSLFSG